LVAFMIWRTRKKFQNTLPFKERAGVGMGFILSLTSYPIPLLTSPLKGEDN